MNTSLAPLALVAPESLPAVSLRRRTFVERARKPFTWVALGAVAWAWIALEPSRHAGWNLAADAAGLLAVVAAMLGRVWCALYIAGRKNAELCQDGPYSLVRNPLYVFSLVGAIGVALATHRWPLVAGVAVLFLVYYHVVMRSEEARLEGLFPLAYPAYRRAVPRFVPRISGFRSRASLTLAPRDVTRAMREVVWFPVAFLGAHLLNVIS